MQEAAQHLGFGGRQQMAKSMRYNPMETIYQILDNLAKLPEKLKIRVAKDLGQENGLTKFCRWFSPKTNCGRWRKTSRPTRGFSTRPR